jgi:hypothetical protein
MKKILTVLALLAVTGTASAQWHHHHGGYYRGGYYGGGNWVAPAIIGGVIGYELSRPPVYTSPVIVQQPPVVIQQQSVPYYGQSQNCTPWTETQNTDGTITRSRTCAQ